VQLAMCSRMATYTWHVLAGQAAGSARADRRRFPGTLHSQGYRRPDMHGGVREIVRDGGGGLASPLADQIMDNAVQACFPAIALERVPSICADLYENVLSA